VENKKRKNASRKKDNNMKVLSVTKKTDDYCIINGCKIEGNACSTILNQR
jgi:hypothetical protein